MTLVLNGTTGVSAVDGSASTPAIQGNDTNTGVFFPAADTVAIATGGTERVRTDSSGNVGIGTSSPGAKLNVAAGDAASAANQVNISGGRSLGANVVGSAGSILFTNSYWTSGYGAAYISGMDSGGSGGLLAFATTSNGGGTTGVPTERARIDSSGYLWVKSSGGTSPWDATSGTYCKFGDIYPIGATAQSSIVAIFNRNTSTGSLIECKYNGNVVGSISVTGSNTAYNTSSDYRLKEDIAPMTGALAKVAALKPVTYKWKSTGETSEGFIAHELQAVVPDCVTGEKDAVDADGKPVYQGIDTSFLVATLTAAIQEQQALITSLTARIAALEGAAS